MKQRMKKLSGIIFLVCIGLSLPLLAGEPTSRGPGWWVKFGCRPPYDQPCIKIWFIELFRGHFFFEVHGDDTKNIDIDCDPESHITASCVWGYTNPDNLEEGIGWTNANVCFNSETRTGYVIEIPGETLEFHQYSEWEQACSEQQQP